MHLTGKLVFWEVFKVKGDKFFSQRCRTLGLTARNVQFHTDFTKEVEDLQTLNEVAESVGMTRRVIQAYEMAGLVSKPVCKNKYGHLLYDREDIYQLWIVRYYRDLGFCKGEIREILDAPNPLERLRAQVEHLKTREKKLRSMIKICERHVSTGENPIDRRFREEIYRNVGYDSFFEILSSEVKERKL